MTRSPRRAIRVVALWVVASVALSVPIAATLAYLRVSPADIPAALESFLDRRTVGEKLIASAQTALADRPNDPKAMAGLASAYLVRARESADPSYYTKASELIDRATALEPNDADIAITAGSLALSRHQFATALQWGKLAARLAPARPAAYGVVTDAFVELGRYDEAVAAAQRMVDLRPDLASLSRVSYLRELHGDIDGAIDAMSRAVAAGGPRSEATAWSEVQLGHLFFAKNDLEAADQAYESSGHRIDGYVYGLAGRARVRAARGDLRGSADLYAEAARRLPVPDVVIALGDVYSRMGDAASAQQQYSLLAAMEKLLAANGVRVDVDMALFDLDRNVAAGDALVAARTEYAARPSTPVTMVLAWAEHRNGESAAAYTHMTEALRLGWRDPLALYRAGVIAEAAGDIPGAVRLLGESERLNPAFSVLYADDLASRLAQLQAAAKR
ncbi:MAG: hypothetical protein M3R54_09330 [Chloroflexota bacterium]|nr:hypothetical protein [Chloroflexota bacterium]